MTGRNEITVWITSGTIRHEFAFFNTMSEAEEFCRMYDYEWIDENEFVWTFEID